MVTYSDNIHDKIKNKLKSIQFFCQKREEHLKVFENRVENMWPD